MIKRIRIGTKIIRLGNKESDNGFEIRTAEISIFINMELILISCIIETSTYHIVMIIKSTPLYKFEIRLLRNIHGDGVHIYVVVYLFNIAG